MSSFEHAHSQWLDQHIQSRSGERKRRLEEGHKHAETEMLRHIWWPMFKYQKVCNSILYPDISR